MFVRTVTLVSFVNVVSLIGSAACVRVVQAQDTAVPARAANSSAAANTEEPAPAPPAVSAATTLEAAVPVDHAALEATTETNVVEHPDRDWTNDPLFLPGAITVGAGGAALLASLLTGLGAHTMYTALEDGCPNNVCSPDQRDRIDSGRSMAVVSTVLTGIGVGAIGVGTVLLIIAGTSEREAEPKYGLALARERFRLTNGPGLWGVGASASF
ncbi:MAG: hypothetical protein RL701_6988 [Pseudomonadota bacterium]|jgi:hypothetical protein